MSTFDERRRSRADWPVRRTTLETESLTDDRITADIQARLAMVAALTYAQWQLAGKQLPRYARADMPGRVLRAK